MATHTVYGGGDLAALLTSDHRRSKNVNSLPSRDDPIYPDTFPPLILDPGGNALSDSYYNKQEIYPAVEPKSKPGEEPNRKTRHEKIEIANRTQVGIECGIRIRIKSMIGIGIRNRTEITIQSRAGIVIHLVRSSDHYLISKNNSTRHPDRIMPVSQWDFRAITADYRQRAARFLAYPESPDLGRTPVTATNLCFRRHKLSFIKTQSKRPNRNSVRSKTDSKRGGRRRVWNEILFLFST
ncbi:hypothetical protein EVAR_71220_1 [Eumeta japonica]|uniref:Uncharacterized protein n=1 Tax=Eumeta variegata TaxID=151549 RepID=A0A4C2A6A0_EUMVA|nr:hypothetical protein EVAR_71220_1 [Eumeta japonica]